jgi:octaprenyl-diphosphate synthase
MSDLKQKIAAAVADDFKSIEAALADHLKPQFNLVDQVAGHILFAGGKRLRPLLMVLTARACGYMGDHLSKYAVIFEYLHAATLLHDDVVDGGQLRRGRRAAHETWNTPTAVLTGDFLLARALSLAADTGLPEVIRTIAAITEQMSQGEIEQLNRKGDIELSEADYLNVIRCKTAVLFRGACRTGALISDSQDDCINAFNDYGYHLGMAFQMADDLLDYTVDSVSLGKKVGADLREGKLTLPVIHALSRLSQDDRQWMVELIQTQVFTPSQFERLIDLLRDSGGISYTRQCAVGHVDKAKAALDMLPNNPESAILADIADYALLRKN